MVEIARALSIEARILILDEPTSSLTDDEVEALFGLVERLREQEVATIFVSHRLNEIFAIADHLTILRDGRTVGAGPAADFDRERAIHLMVGRALEELVPPAESSGDENACIRIRGLTLRGAFEDVDLDIRPGEIVGLAGLVGAGRSELLETLFGLHRVDGGSVQLDGKAATFDSPRAAIKGGAAFVPADRKLQGLVLDMSVHENLVMASTSRLGRFRRPSRTKEDALVTRSIDELQIRAHSHRVPVSTLSGGNQQKVVLGKWLAASPQVLMLDEPTRGVDVGAKAEIYRLLFEAAGRGIAILASSSEIPELLTICDRIVVMFRGRVAATLSRSEATEARIAYFAGGHE
jgi:ABC-type sugar transport system ATPase subunit